MDYSPLGESGLKVSPLWLGTMMFGDQTDEHEAARIVAAAREAGVNAIDTANAYAGGESERITGRLIKADRAHWVLASKAANPMGPGPNDRGLSRRHLLQAVDASLARLGTEWIDVLYLHREDDTTPPGTRPRSLLVGHAADPALRRSRFRAWRSPASSSRCRAMNIAQPIVCQPPYNAMSRDPEGELLPVGAPGVGVVVWPARARYAERTKYRPDAARRKLARRPRVKRILQTGFRARSRSRWRSGWSSAQGTRSDADRVPLGWVWNNRYVRGVIAGPKTSAMAGMSTRSVSPSARTRPRRHARRCGVRRRAPPDPTSGDGTRPKTG